VPREQMAAFVTRTMDQSLTRGAGGRRSSSFGLRRPRSTSG
jgi:hypothetical protein